MSSSAFRKKKTLDNMIKRLCGVGRECDAVSDVVLREEADKGVGLAHGFGFVQAEERLADDEGVRDGELQVVMLGAVRDVGDNGVHGLKAPRRGRSAMPREALFRKIIRDGAFQLLQDVENVVVLWRLLRTRFKREVEHVQ